MAMGLGLVWRVRSRAAGLNLDEDPLGRAGRAALSRLGKSVRTDIVTCVRYTNQIDGWIYRSETIKGR